MSKGDPKGRPRIAQQPTLFGGVDVVCLYGEGGRTRANVLHAASTVAAREFVISTRQLERAELIELPATAERPRCPNCHREGELDRDFGTRVVRGRRVRQSWCRACRQARASSDAQR